MTEEVIDDVMRSIFGRYDDMTDMMKQAMTTYSALVSELKTDKQKYLFHCVCSLFSFANKAYLALSDITMDEKNRIFSAGAFADMYISMEDHLKEMMNLTDDTFCVWIQKKSDGLAARQWTSIPSPISNGVKVKKFARGMMSDMREYSKAAIVLRSESRISAQGRGESHSKKDDGKSIASDSDRSRSVLEGYIERLQS